MKNFLLLLSIFFSTYPIFGQQAIHLESAELQNRVFSQSHVPILTGKLLNYDPDKHKDLVIRYRTPAFSMERYDSHLLTPNPDGTFEIKLSYGFPYQHVLWEIGNIYFGVIIADQEVQVRADLEQFTNKRSYYHTPAITYHGKDAALNECYNRYLDYRRGKGGKLNLRKMAQQEEDLEKSIAKIRHVYQKKQRLIEAFLKKFPSSYGYLLENEHVSGLYSTLFYILRQRRFNENIWQEAMQHQPIMFSSSSLQYYIAANSCLYIPDIETKLAREQKVIYKELPTSTDQTEVANFFTAYKNMLLKQVYDTLAYSSGKQIFLDPYEEQLLHANFLERMKKFSELPQQKADLLRLVWRHNDLKMREAYVRKALLLTQTPWCKRFLEQSLVKDSLRMAEFQDMLEQSQEAEAPHALGIGYQRLGNDIHLYVSNHTSVQELLQSIRHNFPEKALILDIWTPWCGPCIKDMLNSKPVKQKIKDLPVEIVYLCIESSTNQKKWKERLAEIQTPGTHIYLTHKLSMEFMSYFDLSHFPSYLFIDRSGKLNTGLVSRISTLNVSKLKKYLE